MSFDFTAQPVGVGEKELATISVFGFQYIVKEAVHDSFESFRIEKPTAMGLFNLICGRAPRTITNSGFNFRLSKRYAAGGFDQTIRIGNETDVYSVSDVFHGFPERCVCLQFSQIRFEIGLRLASTFVAQFDPRAKPGRLFEGNDSVNFGDF